MPKPKLNPRQLEVLGKTRLTQHLVRVTLGGEALQDFPEHQESAYVKLLYPQEGSDQLLTRTYTIARQRPEQGQSEDEHRVVKRRDADAEG